MKIAESYRVKNVELTVPVAVQPLASAEARRAKRGSRSRFVHYKADDTAGNLSLDSGTAQAAERIETNSNIRNQAPQWAHGTRTDGNDEHTTLIDSAHFNKLLAIIAKAPGGAEASSEDDLLEDDPLLESDYELTRVHIGDLLGDQMTAPNAGRRVEEEVTAPVARLNSEELTVVTSSPRRPVTPPVAVHPASPVAAYSASPALARPAHRNDEHTSILTEGQREEWLQQNAQEHTAILSLPEVAQWLEKPQRPAMPQPVAAAPSTLMPAPMPAPMPTFGAPALSPSAGEFPNAPMDMAQGTISPGDGMPSDEDLFALPHQVDNAQSAEPASKWIGNLFLGLFALMAVAAGLAFALPAQRAEVQERIFPSAKAPAVTGVTRGEAIAVSPSEVEMGAQETARLMSKAASAVASGRRSEALKIYQDLSEAQPSVPLYANLVHALKVSEATK